MGHCIVDGKFQWCMGCGRDVWEIEHWRDLTPKQQEAILLKIPKRMRTMIDEKQKEVRG